MSVFAETFPVSDKCLNEDGYLYQDLKSVGKEKEKHIGLVTN